jgi:hypothetical protein
MPRTAGTPFTPEQRSQRARIGAYAALAAHGGSALTEKARAASPGGDAYWDSQVDPDGALPPAERSRRAQAAKKAHFSKLALASSRARGARKAAKQQGGAS